MPRSTSLTITCISNKCVRRTAARNPSARRRFAIQYPSAPCLVILGGENAQTAVEALVVTTEPDRETCDRFLESDPGDQDVLRRRLGDHAGVSLPQAITQGFGVSGVDRRDVGAALRGAEVLHEEPSGELGYFQDVRLGHQKRLLDMGLQAGTHRARTAAEQCALRTRLRRSWSATTLVERAGQRRMGKSVTSTPVLTTARYEPVRVR